MTPVKKVHEFHELVLEFEKIHELVHESEEKFLNPQDKFHELKIHEP